jgi:protein-tyrosine phosphatase
MIDIHSHIIHGLDDGADSFETSRDMLRIAQETGTTDIVASPHANISYPYDPETIDAKIRALQEVAEIKIHRGCDFHLSLSNIQMAVQEPARFSINGLGYLLVEFPDVAPLRGIDHIFAALREAGLTPIVTHPERNSFLASDVERLARWVENGIYLQLTAQSVTGELFGSETSAWCERVLKMGLVHFVASDGHEAHTRTPRLDRARVKLEKDLGEECAELLLEIHPRAVIEGVSLPVGPLAVKDRARARKWFQFRA